MQTQGLARVHRHRQTERQKNRMVIRTLKIKLSKMLAIMIIIMPFKINNYRRIIAIIVTTTTTKV